MSAAVAVMAVPASAAAAATLAPHRAVYDLAPVDDATMRENAGAMSGRMVYEFTGAACEGYTVNFRFVLQTTNGDGRATVTDLRTSSFEDGPGTRFTFLSQTYTDARLIEDVRGSARRDDEEVSVALSKPAPKTVVFGPSTTFPTAQLLDVIRAAGEGRRIVTKDVFDGSNGGGKAYRTTAVIGRQKTGPVPAPLQGLAAMPRWPVTISYFDGMATGDSTPEYTISFDLFENGVSSDLRMDYGDFALRGTLTRYEALDPPACP